MILLKETEKRVFLVKKKTIHIYNTELIDLKVQVIFYLLTHIVS